MLRQQQAGATPEGQAAIQAALNGSFGGGQDSLAAAQQAEAQRAEQAQAQQAAQPPHGKAAAVAFDNEAANLASGGQVEE
jgi:hypothetical protein